MLDFILQYTQKCLSRLEKLSSKEKALIHYNVSFALNQTKSYISSTRDLGPDKSSSILSNIWQRTAKNINVIKNPDVKILVKTLEEKSKYWADPKSYSSEEFDKYNMRISEVASTLNKICE